MSNRRAKIVCTLGPATSSPERISELIEAGMDVARLNFSHGDHESHRQVLETIRRTADEHGRAVGVLLDLQGPKIRVGKFADGQVELHPGAEFAITTELVLGDQHRVSTSYRQITSDVRVGDQILLDDGFLTLAVTDVGEKEVRTVVVSGGTLKNNKGINLPNVQISAPAITKKDRADLAFGMRHGVDYVALSFVRTPEDILQARQLATAGDQRLPIIAKIEKPQAVDRLEEIVEVADGIMVARGDLGVEMGPEKVPMIQKALIALTNSRGKVVITATQMLESMIRHSRPTRAEASDVANAVLDGSDALMLSGETAVGAHPIEAVRTMSRIIAEVEGSGAYRASVSDPHLDLPVSANAIAHAAVVAARQMNIKVVVVMTNSGGAARLMSEYRPEAAILALTTNEVTYRRLAAYWGVTPVMVAPMASVDELVDRAEQEVIERGLAASGDHIVLTAAIPIGAGTTTNMLRIKQLA